jgi:hypothetical protein
LVIKPTKENIQELVVIYSKIKCLILDSPFTSCKKMIQMIMTNNLNMGKILSGIVFYFLRKTINNKTKFDVLGKNDPISKVGFINLPCCFLIGDGDSLVDQNEFKEMFSLTNSERKTLRYMVDTDHGDFRK